MTSGRVWAGRLAALVVAIIIPACQSTNPGAVGVSSSSLWISSSGIGSQPGGTVDWWHDPNTGQTDLFVPDPYDIVTYTRPTIWRLGLNHPLMTDVQAKQFPNIIYNEQRAMDLINLQRETVFVFILGKPLPYTLVAKLTDHTGVRQNCRAHAKHYAVWHPTLPFPGNGGAWPDGPTEPPNDEGDVWYNPDPAVNSRFERVGLAVTAGWELPLAGSQWRSGDDVATEWIKNYAQKPLLKTDPVRIGDVLLDVNMTHMSVGFWQLGGTGLVYYWSLIICKDPNNSVTLPNVPFGGVGL